MSEFAVVKNKVESISKETPWGHGCTLHRDSEQSLGITSTLMHKLERYHKGRGNNTSGIEKVEKLVCEWPSPCLASLEGTKYQQNTKPFQIFSASVSGIDPDLPISEEPPRMTKIKKGGMTVDVCSILVEPVKPDTKPMARGLHAVLDVIWLSEIIPRKGKRSAGTASTISITPVSISCNVLTLFPSNISEQPGFTLIMNTNNMSYSWDLDHRRVSLWVRLRYPFSVNPPQKWDLTLPTSTSKRGLNLP